MRFGRSARNDLVAPSEALLVKRINMPYELDIPGSGKSASMVRVLHELLTWRDSSLFLPKLVADLRY